MYIVELCFIFFLYSMDIRLKVGRTMQVVGPSGCGKTLFTVRLLRKRETLFEYPLKKIWWYYGADEGEVGETKEEIQKLENVEFIHGLDGDWLKRPQAHDVIVIDDLFQEAMNTSGKSNKQQQSLTSLFTKTTRHRELFVIFLTQNLFHQGARACNINTHYLVLFKNPRDVLSVINITRQISNSAAVKKIFHDVTKDTPHAYLFLDFTQECPDDLRIRSHILTPPIMVYKPVSEN